MSSGLLIVQTSALIQAEFSSSCPKSGHDEIVRWGYVDLILSNMDLMLSLFQRCFFLLYSSGYDGRIKKQWVIVVKRIGEINDLLTYV